MSVRTHKNTVKVDCRWAIGLLFAKGIAYVTKIENYPEKCFYWEAGKEPLYFESKRTADDYAFGICRMTLLTARKRQLRSLRLYKKKGRRASSIVKTQCLCRTKTGVAAERDKFKFSTVGASIHGTAVARITTVEHFVNVFHFTVTCVNGIFNFFIIVGENFF